MKYLILALISLPALACDKSVDQVVIQALMHGDSSLTVRYGCTVKCYCMDFAREINSDDAKLWRTSGDFIEYDPILKASDDNVWAAKDAARQKTSARNTELMLKLDSKNMSMEEIKELLKYKFGGK